MGISKILVSHQTVSILVVAFRNFMSVARIFQKS